MNGTNDRPTLSPSGIGQYIAFSECPRYFKLRFDDQGEENDRAWNEAFKPLSVLLSGTGESFEDETREVIERGAAVSERADEQWDFDFDFDEEFQEAVAASREGLADVIDGLEDMGAEEPVLLYEAPLCGRIEVWPIGGRADVIALWFEEDGTLRAHVLEIKASWKRKSYHQIQATIYAMLLEDALQEFGLSYDLSAGVIHRELEPDELSIDELPSFDLETRVADVRRLLSEGGKVDRILARDVQNVKYQLDAKCNNCIFNESCFTRAIEGKKTALLGLTVGEQKALERHGIETVEQVAALKRPPRNPMPWIYDNLEPRADQEEPVNALLNEPAIGRKLDQIIQRAQSMLGQVHPGHEDGREEPFAPFYAGAGNGTLPDDDPNDALNVGYESGEMVRVYLHIEWDYMRDRLVMMSARVDCTNFEGEPASFSEVTERLPDDPEDSKEVEKDLMERFFDRLFREIQAVAAATGNPEQAPIHLYVFSRLERDRLIDAVRRHPEFVGSDVEGQPHPVRDLLGLRAAIDQSMLSVVQEDLEDRLALQYPSSGLLPALKQFIVEGSKWTFNDWEVEREDGTSINLHRIFYHNFFNHESPYRLADDGSIRMMLERGAHSEPEREGFYPLRARFGNQVPLEYIWAAKDKLDTDWAGEDQHQERRAIEKYTWYYREEQEDRIREEELELLGEKLCHALSHIEQGIPAWGKNAFLGKEPIDIPTLTEFNLGETGLARACREYLELEYYSNRQDKLRQYARAPRQRVQTGRSAVVRVERTAVTPEGLEVEGSLLYDELDFSNPDQIANACRLKGSEGSTSGSWMVATEIERDDHDMFREVGGATPEDIEGSVPCKVTEVSPQDREITLKFSNFYNEEEGHGHYLDREFETRHRSWTVDPGQAGRYTEYIEEGNVYILDEQTDDMTARRAGHTLDVAGQNHMTSILEGFLDGEEISNELEFCSRRHTEAFIQWLEDDEELDTPNDAQKRFIRRDDRQVACLHGPPGTGKTGGGLAYAILTRAYGRIAAGDHLRGIVTAPSNKAVREILEDVGEVRQRYSESGDGVLDDLRIIRVMGRDTSGLDQVEGVEYLNYGQDEDGVADLADDLDVQRGLDAFMGGDVEPPRSVLIFATPSGSYGLMDKIAREWGADNARDILGRVQSFFNFLGVDEASMMPLSQLILCGAFINQGSQILVAGDHRQMPPIQHHDWDREDRRTVEELAPYLSALDFFRFLKGELVVEHADVPESSDLPMDRLELTYRCHVRVAEMLRRWLYERYDEIEYRSREEETLREPVTAVEGARSILDPDHPLVLVLHDEETSQQANPAEVAVTEALVQGVDEQESIGVVTPHNAQRGLLRNELGDAADIDTVERFQGGERDLIIVSGTASDPESIRRKHDFILSPNRLNVAMSRMKKKLVVVASRSMFEVIPADAEDYEDALLWRGLYHEVEAGESDPLWSGTLEDLVDGGVDESVSDVGIEVYSGS